MSLLSPPFVRASNKNADQKTDDHAPEHILKGEEGEEVALPRELERRPEDQSKDTPSKSGYACQNVRHLSPCSVQALAVTKRLDRKNNGANGSDR